MSKEKGLTTAADRTEMSTAEKVRRIAEIEDELASRGADPLLDELAEIKAEIKEEMVESDTDVAFDETSGWEAVVVWRASDKWDLAKLQEAVGDKYERYTKTTVDTAKVKNGIKRGDLRRPVLEAAGVVKRGKPTPALYVRERVEEEDDE